ncbi:glycoside hydrolase family 3 N-terminal domain-containing protein [Aureitalea marina]|uniref:Glycosyl hydrolase n=1 Tax=Aureitalea marina TaxID=930804 RepID=A0A2S7KSV6_9FLAO|nr:glycoside hydrolase family 3 N-terminal domain-containing protein [Aureitalea marina]PQB05697.1 glycosyl hydrolase [Aureitalea marina]
MKKTVKKSLNALGLILLLIITAGLFTGWYFNRTFLDFEGDYAEQLDFETLKISGYSFLDRNGNGELDPYEDNRLSVEKRVANLLELMSVEEKIHLLKGSGIASAMGRTEPGTGIPGAVGTIVPTPRLGLPTIYLSDGPAGLRIQPTREGEDRTYYCTAFPIATLLASTWNEDLAMDVGSAMGNEAKEYGIDVILGPGANIQRHPRNGRNFEYYSEDPLLSGYMGAAIVNGIQSHGVGTSVKHYVANNQETERSLNDVRVSERAMREIYLKGFEHIVHRSQPWTIMSSYNKVNGTYVSESPYLLTDVLRGDWGFEGLVMTDWYGGRNAVDQIMAGNDLLEPGTRKQWNALTEGYEDGKLSMEAIDTSVGRILKLILASHKMKQTPFSNDPNLEAHAAITRQSATEGMVLLKNEQTLPLAQGLNVALLATTSYDFIAGGTGSGDVNEAYTVSLEEGLTGAGFTINETAKKIFDQHKTDNAEFFVKPEGMDALFNPYLPPQLSYSDDQMSQIASSADVGVLTIGRNAGEGGDRVMDADFLLTDQELTMITQAKSAFHDQGKKLVIVLNIGGVIETASWKDHPDAILLAWQGGQEGGNSVADILSGQVNPSGKLPVTFPIAIDDHASDSNFPVGGGHLVMTDLIKGMMFPPQERPDDEKQANMDYTVYEEGIYVGYRHFDKRGIVVSYPFGYGLSYSEFDYSDLMVDQNEETATIRLMVTNIGQVAGKEVVQLYSSLPLTKIDRPERELRSFSKTKILQPGESQEISLQFPISELRYWDEDQEGWKLEDGAYSLEVGASSREIKLQQQLIPRATKNEEDGIGGIGSIRSSVMQR